MGWADAKWGSDRTVDNVLSTLCDSKEWHPSDTIMQTVISEEVFGGSNSAISSMGSFVFSGPQDMRARIKANLRNNSTSGSYYLFICTTNDYPTAQTSELLNRPDAYGVIATIEVTSSSWTEFSFDVSLIAGKTYYIFGGVTYNSSSVHVYCNSLTVCYSYGYVPRKPELGTVSGYASSETLNLLDVYGSGKVRVFLTNTSSNSLVLTVAIDGVSKQITLSSGTTLVTSVASGSTSLPWNATGVSLSTTMSYSYVLGLELYFNQSIKITTSDASYSAGRRYIVNYELYK